MTFAQDLWETPFDELSPTQAIDPAWIKSGRVEEAGILLHASADSKFVVQLWECRSAVELDFESYPVDEFVTIIAGEVVVERKDGPSTTYRTGESFMLPKGMAGTWRQAGRIRKYSVCYLG
jgi:uncharacterized cupin superfamily protein